MCDQGAGGSGREGVPHLALLSSSEARASPWPNPSRSPMVGSSDDATPAEGLGQGRLRAAEKSKERAVPGRQEGTEKTGFPALQPGSATGELASLGK